LLNAALVLCADHGLNVTAFTVRCVASAGATPHGAVNAGLSAARGQRHTGNTARIAALLREAGSPDAFRDTVAQRLRRGDVVPGFGHRLYPDGDPRAVLLVERLRAVAPETAGTAFATAAQEVGPDLLDRPPAIDFALVALARALNLPPEAPLTLFALGRMVGWTGHLIEQYEKEQVIRPRAQYTGPPPADA
jgi:citrate synthase